MGLFIAHLLLSFGLVVMGYHVMSKVTSDMKELLAVLYFVAAIVLIIATAIDLYTHRKTTQADPFGVNDEPEEF